MASPPKPWERAAGTTTSAAVPSAATTTATATAAPATAAAAPLPGLDAPALPARPDSLSQIAVRNASNYSPANAYNRSPYSSYGYGGMSSYSSPYSSPFNRFGGGMMGGYGGMGGMYNSFGMGGMGYGPGMYGQPGMGMGPNGQEQSLTQAYTQGTQATFAMIESIVGAFGGFAQMLESTYMATHSSFFAMVSVAEQFGNLKQTLGSVLGIFTIMRWIRTAIAKLTGRPPPASSTDLTPANFAAFNGSAPDGSPAQPRPSRKPFIFFIVAVFGLPYLMTKLIRALAASQEAEQQRLLANAPYGVDAQTQQPLDPSKLDFCRLLYDYTPQVQPGQQLQDGIDLAVKKGDLVAVLSKSDPAGQPSEWWRCRARDGRMGYLPAPYLETIQRRPQQGQIAAKSNATSPAHSRVNTMTGSIASPSETASTGSASRAQSMKITEREKAEIRGTSKEVPGAKKNVKDGGKPDLPSIETFQRGGFYQ